jgi:hypothetical protein
MAVIRYYILPILPPLVEPKPSWEDLRSREYCKIAQHADIGISHSRAWENSKIHRVHTLRVRSDFVQFLKKRRGPKRRRSSRVIGKTPDDSFIQPGQRPNGLPHQLRGQMNRLFACEGDFLERMLVESMDYKPPKKVRVNLVMPNLEVAIEELFHEMVARNPSLRNHPAFKRRWAPAICRLIELRWLARQRSHK